jgi:3-oxoacyl-[acyl-carrier protein] reductase
VDYFLAEGAEVLGISRGESTVTHPRYHHFTLSISDSDQVSAFFKTVRTKFSRLDILVNNAAVLTSQYAVVMPTKNVVDMINTNLLGAFLVTREAAKIMMKHRYGRIISIGSMAQSLEPIGDSVYAATKSAMSTITDILAKELSTFNITCNNFGITAFRTDMLAQLPAEKVAEVIADLPIPRMAEIEDIHHVIDFFASEKSSYITAQTVYLGGVN